MSDRQHGFMGVVAITVVSLLPTPVPPSTLPPAAIDKPVCAPKMHLFLCPLDPTSLLLVRCSNSSLFSSLVSFSLQWIYSFAVF